MMVDEKILKKIAHIEKMADESLEGDLDLSEAMWEIQDAVEDIWR